MDTAQASSRPRLLRAGKVRDVYDVDDRLLLVATDRISAFDVVLPTLVPGKGTVLTQLSRFWFEKLADVVPNHMTDAAPSSIDVDLRLAIDDLDERALVVRRAERIDIECVVRGYLAGSAWSAYRKDLTVFGHRLPAGLGQAARLPEPIFTPAIKNDAGHDETITIEELRSRVGRDVADRLEEHSMTLFGTAAAHCDTAGIVLADTKFEFGWIDGRLSLIDEALTPDSSRLWDRETYVPGNEPPSFDKQFVRDWLISTGWDRQPPGPELPPEIVDGTASRYREAFRRLTGSTIDDWLRRQAA